MPNRSSLPGKNRSPRYKNVVGSAVRRLRTEREWTQDDFAAKLQVLGWSRCTRSWLSRIEARLVAVRDYELTYFCTVFQVPLQALYPSLNPKKVDPNLNETP